MTARQPRPRRTRWVVGTAAAIGGVVLLAMAGVLVATHGASLAEAGAAVSAALGSGCARLSCVLDAGAGHVFLVGKIAATLGALARTVLALG